MSDSHVSRITVVKCLGPRLVPFFKAFALLYVLFPKNESSVSYCVFKCAPILCLIGFVVVYGLRAPQNRSYSGKILVGLICSCIGDGLLVWSSAFVPGVIFFAIAHIAYVLAFGFRPLAPTALPVASLLMVVVYNLLYPELSTFYRLLGAAYEGILTLMVWRAAAELFTSGPGPLAWTSISRALGASLFAISDCILCVSLFHKGGTALSVLILPTYYAAQMCITVSVVDRKLNSLKTASVQEESEAIRNGGDTSSLITVE